MGLGPWFLLQDSQLVFSYAAQNLIWLLVSIIFRRTCFQAFLGWLFKGDATWCNYKDQREFLENNLKQHVWICGVSWISNTDLSFVLASLGVQMDTHTHNVGLCLFSTCFNHHFSRGRGRHNRYFTWHFRLPVSFMFWSGWNHQSGNPCSIYSTTATGERQQLSGTHTIHWWYTPVNYHSYRKWTFYLDDLRWFTH